MAYPQYHPVPNNPNIDNSPGDGNQWDTSRSMAASRNTGRLSRNSRMTLSSTRPLMARLESEETVARDKRSGFFSGWKAGASFAALSALVVMGCNICLLVIGQRKFEEKDGLGTLFSGSCERTKYLDTWAHFAINILGSALLVAGNYTMQVLSSPTRTDVDNAHRQRKWMDIGIPSLRNLNKVPKIRSALYAAMALSSIPLHLLYNSAIMSTLSSYSYQHIVVAHNQIDSFLNGEPFRSTKPSVIAATKQLELVQKKAKGFDVLEREKCLHEYGRELLMSRRNVIVVVLYENATEPIVDWGSHDSLNEMGTQPFKWLCSKEHMTNDKCDLAKVVANLNEWAIEGHKVEYCLSERREETCMLQFSSRIMYIIIVANTIKAIVIIWTLCLYDGENPPLVTQGDAIDSFLRKPDEETKGICTVNKGDISKRHVWGFNYQNRPPVPWKNTKHRWLHSASFRRWFTCYILSGAAIAVTSYLLYAAKVSLTTNGIDFEAGSLWKMGFKNFDTRVVVKGYVSGSAVVSNAMKTNLPQIIVSFLYLNYNGIYTCMLNGKEWNNFALKKRSLRVTDPVGIQRETYFLSLPYRYAIPLMTCSLFLHWLVSQSLFLIRVKVIDFEHVEPSGKIVSKDDIRSVCGYTVISVVLAIILALIMLVTAIVFGLRRYTGQIPLAAACSVIISAACHPLEREIGMLNIDLLKWGVVEEDSGSGAGGHCAFSCEVDVTQPVPGRYYRGLPSKTALQGAV